MVVVREVVCKSILSRCGIQGMDYSINPYLGCQHACVYCYARFMLKYRGGDEDWGEFVDVRVNAPRVLARQLPKARVGSILVSSVTDPYQPLEGKYELTRKILAVLLRRDFPVSILTKSALVVRDVDLLRRFSGCEVGMTVTTVDEEVRRRFELNSSKVEEKLSALRALHDGGLRTYAFIGPVLPFLAEEGMESLIRSLSEVGVGRVLVDRLNIKYGNWRIIRATLERYYPELLPKYESVLFSPNDYFDRVKAKMASLFKREKMSFEFCY